MTENEPVSAMLNEERRRYILAMLQRHGKVVVTELSTDLHVSIDTIRRDIRELAEAGLLQRVHGGALPPSETSIDYRVRQEHAPQAKAAIARAAVQLLRNGHVIFLDGGTTTLQVAQYLPRTLHATIITNSPPIALALAEHAYVDVYLIGGQLFKSSLITVGAAAIAEVQMTRADVCLVGVCSLHPEHGLSVPDREEAYLKRLMITNAAETMALVSAEKLGTLAPYIVAPLRDITGIVTDASVPTETLTPYRAHGIMIIQP